MVITIATESSHLSHEFKDENSYISRLISIIRAEKTSIQKTPQMYSAKREALRHPGEVFPGFLVPEWDQTPAEGWNRRTYGGCWQNWKIREANSGRSPLPSRIDAVI